MQILRLAAVSALRAVFGEPHAVAVAEGWRALAHDGALVEDLAHLGHLFEDPLTDPDTGEVYSHAELIARAARKGLVLQLLARAEITTDELNFIRRKGDTGNEILSFDNGPDASGAADGAD